jgi:hypothetical protein
VAPAVACGTTVEWAAWRECVRSAAAGLEATLALKIRPYTSDAANESGRTAGEVLGFSRL